MQEVNGNEYRVGCTYCVLYESSGISLDWAHGKVKYYFKILIITMGNIMIPSNMVCVLNLSNFHSGWYTLFNER